MPRNTNEVDGFEDDDFELNCHICGTPLFGWDFGHMVAAEINFRQHFPQTWAHMPRVILCGICYDRERRDNPPPAWA
jgi:hypothetical protein